MQIDRIYLENCKFQPVESSNLLKDNNFLTNFSQLAIPKKYRQ